MPDNILENDPKVYHQNIYNETILNIEDAIANGELDEETGEEYKLQALSDLQVRLLIEDGYEEEDAIRYVFGEDAFEEDDSVEEEIPINYSENNMASANFNSENLNNFAIALQELIEEEYETLEDGVLSLSEATGYEPDEVVMLLTGEGVPEEDLVDDIATCFDTIIGDRDAYVTLHLLAGEARGEDMTYDIEDEYEEGTYDEDYEEENTYDPELEAAYSEVENLKNKVAEFEASQVLGTTLDQLVRRGEQLKADMILTPVEFNALFGEVPNALQDEKVAMFTSLCQQSNVSIDTELYAMNKVLELIERRGPLLPNGRIVTEEFNSYDQEKAEFNADLKDQAARNLEMMKNSNHFNGLFS